MEIYPINIGGGFYPPSGNRQFLQILLNNYTPIVVNYITIEGEPSSGPFENIVTYIWKQACGQNN